MGWLSWLFPGAAPDEPGQKNYTEAERQAMVAQSEANIQNLMGHCESILQEAYIAGSGTDKLKFKMTVGREMEFVAFSSNPDAVEARLKQLLEASRSMRQKIDLSCPKKSKDFDNNSELKESIKNLFRYTDSPEELDKVVSDALKTASQIGNRRDAVHKLQEILMSKYGDMNLESETTDFMQVELEKLDDAFNIKKNHPSLNIRERTRLMEEYTLGLHLAHDPKLGKHGHYQQPNVAMVQLELASYPHSHPIAASRWGFAIANHVRELAQEYGFDRIRFSTKADANVLANGTHLNFALWAEIEKEDGTKETLNLMEAAQLHKIFNGHNPLFIDEGLLPDVTQLSDLALCCGKATNEFLQHSMLPFAPSDESYVRFTPDEIIGPAFGGFTDRKKRGGMGTAMFRGGGRKTNRAESNYADVPDSGPVRLEMRFPANEASGLGFLPTSITDTHGETIEYGNMRPLASFSMEAATKIIADGFELWQARRNEKISEAYIQRKLGYAKKDAENWIKNGIMERSETKIYLVEREQKLRKDVYGELTEKVLLNERFKLFQRKSEAERKFMESAEAQAYWGERLEQLIKLGTEMDRREALEYSRRYIEKTPLSR